MGAPLNNTENILKHPFKSPLGTSYAPVYKFVNWYFNSFAVKSVKTLLRFGILCSPWRRSDNFKNWRSHGLSDGYTDGPFAVEVFLEDRAKTAVPAVFHCMLSWANRQTFTQSDQAAVGCLFLPDSSLSLSLSFSRWSPNTEWRSSCLCSERRGREYNRSAPIISIAYPQLPST